MSKDELENLQDFKLTEGPTKIVEDSRYLCYGSEVQNLTQVDMFYKHIKVKYVDATHVAMAVVLPGQNFAENKFYIDDGDVGTGRTALNSMLDANVSAYAVAVVRYFGTKHLKNKRFDAVAEITQKLMEQVAGGHPPLSLSRIKFPVPTLKRWYRQGLERRGGRGRTAWSISTRDTSCSSLASYITEGEEASSDSQSIRNIQTDFVEDLNDAEAEVDQRNQNVTVISVQAE